VLALLEEAALALHAREAAMFANAPPQFTLISPLASGADQIAADVALVRGWTLQAVLPFSAGDYAASMAEEDASKLRRLLHAAKCVFELGGHPDEPIESFVLAGRATIAHADLLIAAWDGEPARGRGGTAETVNSALMRGTPILHLPIDPAQPTTLLWSAFDPVVVTAPGDAYCGRPASPPNLCALLNALLSPPQDDRERRFIHSYRRERSPEYQWRLEYPLLMMLTGAHRLSREDMKAGSHVQAANDEWCAYPRGCAACHAVDVPLDTLQAAYVWSDRLASHFAQTYRSSHVLNFLLAALGAWIGLIGLVLTANPLHLASAEAAVVLTVIINTQAGTRRCWHQRWLDYRQLSERLRPMRSLKLLGIAAPDPPGSPAEPVVRRWIDWYAAAVWRNIGCPTGKIEAEQVRPLAAAIAAHELQPQIDYNRRTAHKVATFDRRLEWGALLIFGTTLVITLLTVGSLLFEPGLLAWAGNWTVVLSAGLPALGAAIFGIRVQGDFGALATRSSSTADQLERIADDLATATSLKRTADLLEQAARLMLADLGEWRLVNELHELSLA
jgi:hypothetical protein